MIFDWAYLGLLEKLTGVAVEGGEHLVDGARCCDAPRISIPHCGNAAVGYLSVVCNPFKTKGGNLTRGKEREGAIERERETQRKKRGRERRRKREEREKEQDRKEEKEGREGAERERERKRERK